MWLLKSPMTTFILPSVALPVRSKVSRGGLYTELIVIAIRSIERTSMLLPSDREDLSAARPLRAKIALSVLIRWSLCDLGSFWRFEAQARVGPR